MNQMKKLHIIYFTIIAFAITSCQPQIPDPDTDAVYKSITKVFELTEDGAVNYQYQHELKYLTHYAFNRAHGESFIVYNPLKQELKINKSATKMVDGKIVHSPENAFNKVLPRFAAGAPAYNHLREMVVTHAGLEVGAIVNFDYELRSEAGYIPFLNENLVLAERTPIQQMEVIVKIPADKTLNYKLLNSTVEPKISEKNGLKTYTWKFNQIDQLSFESDQPHYNETSPRLSFSTATVEEALKSLTIDNTITEEVTTVIDKKLEGKKTVFEKVFALQNIVANEINAFHIPIEHTGYQLTPNIDVWKRNGATEIEKVVMLNALLNHYKIEAKPIFVYPTSYFTENSGLLKEAGHPYVYCVIEDEPLVISGNSTRAGNNLFYALHNEVLVDFEGNKIEVDEMFSQKNKIAVEGKLKLDKKNALKGEIEFELAGKVNPYFKYVKDEKNAKKIAAKMISGSKVTDFELSSWDNKTSKVKAEIEKKDASKKQANYLFMNIPKSALGIDASHLDVLTEKRIAPIQINGPIDESYDFTIEIPENYELVSNQIDTTIQNSVGEVNFKIEVTESGLMIHKKLNLNIKIIPAVNYADFRNLMLLWYNKSYKELIFKEVE
jgi:Domain of Unknown Function with PDB structure (DUF3857)/Domain of Unknown Function with PDB structure (DUF3858)